MTEATTFDRRAIYVSPRVAHGAALGVAGAAGSQSRRQHSAQVGMVRRFALVCGRRTEASFYGRARAIRVDTEACDCRVFCARDQYGL